MRKEGYIGCEVEEGKKGGLSYIGCVVEEGKKGFIKKGLRQKRGGDGKEGRRGVYIYRVRS